MNREENAVELCGVDVLHRPRCLWQTAAEALVPSRMAAMHFVRCDWTSVHVKRHQAG